MFEEVDNIIDRLPDITEQPIDIIEQPADITDQPTDITNHNQHTDIMEQTPDNSLCCIDDNQVNNDTPNMSDVRTSQVCVPSDRRASSDSHTHHSNTGTESTNHQPTIESDYEVCVQFYERTCGCQKADGKPCSSLFTLEHFFDMRSQASLMTHQELDLVLLGSLMTTLHDHDTTAARGRHKPAKRTKVTSHFMHNGYHVCIKTFAFLFGIGANHRIKAIRKHYLENGMEPRVHKNTKRLPSKTASYEDLLALVKFLQNYAETNAILLPGRIPSYKRDDLKLLPSNTSKKVIHNIICTEITSFNKFVKVFLINILSVYSSKCQMTKLGPQKIVMITQMPQNIRNIVYSNALNY